MPEPTVEFTFGGAKFPIVRARRSGLRRASKGCDAHCTGQYASTRGLWNELAVTHAFSLLCAYEKSNTYKDAHSQHFHEVFRQHAHVIPCDTGQRNAIAARLLASYTSHQRRDSLDT